MAGNKDSYINPKLEEKHRILIFASFGSAFLCLLLWVGVFHEESKIYFYLAMLCSFLYLCVTISFYVMYFWGGLKDKIGTDHPSYTITWITTGIVVGTLLLYPVYQGNIKNVIQPFITVWNQLY
ncbi:MAG: hypothetical protein EB023_07580 [Flavobacteriia bacterium]|nr:hypothetical protein [Flavobacteriia bacterium]